MTRYAARVTCISKLPKDVNKDICICATSFYICSENTHNKFIIWKIKKKYKKVTIFAEFKDKSDI